jgi:WD40 repeat protein
VTLVELEAGHRVSKFVTAGADIEALAISPDSVTLAAAMRRPTAIGLWDVRTRQLLMQLDTELDHMTDLVFSADGCRLMASGANSDGAVESYEWSIDHPPTIKP